MEILKSQKLSFSIFLVLRGLKDYSRQEFLIIYLNSKWNTTFLKTRVIIKKAAWLLNLRYGINQIFHLNLYNLFFCRNFYFLVYYVPQLYHKFLPTSDCDICVTSIFYVCKFSKRLCVHWFVFYMTDFTETEIYILMVYTFLYILIAFKEYFREFFRQKINKEDFLLKYVILEKIYNFTSQNIGKI